MAPPRHLFAPSRPTRTVSPRGLFLPEGHVQIQRDNLPPVLRARIDAEDGGSYLNGTLDWAMLRVFRRCWLGPLGLVFVLSVICLVIQVAGGYEVTFALAAIVSGRGLLLGFVLIPVVWRFDGRRWSNLDRWLRVKLQERPSTPLGGSEP
jgi:hypothetical protein